MRHSHASSGAVVPSLAEARRAALALRAPTERDPIDVRAAHLVLAPLLLDVFERFAEAGLERLDGLDWRISQDQGGEGRNFAACRTDGRLIVLSPDLVLLPEDTVWGILAHELGHAADFLYPAQFVAGASGGMRLLDAGKKGIRTGRKSITDGMLRDWEERDHDEVERTADRIAEHVCGITIGYAGPCLLQTVGHGVRPRPKGLR